MHRDAKANLIRTIPAFEECTDVEIARIASVAQEVDFAEGWRLAGDRAPAQEILILVEGTADVCQGDQVVNRIGAGDFVGEIALSSGLPRTATVVATSRVHCLMIEGSAFERVLSETPQIKTSVERAARQLVQEDTTAEDATPADS